MLEIKIDFNCINYYSFLNYDNLPEFRDVREEMTRINFVFEGVRLIIFEMIL